MVHIFCSNVHHTNIPFLDDRDERNSIATKFVKTMIIEMNLQLLESTKVPTYEHDE